MHQILETEENEILQRCHDFLENWETITIRDIEIIRISTGIANKTYHVSIKNSKALNNIDIEHKEVIVRIYNSGVFKNYTNIKFNGEAAEVLAMQILSEHGLAAKLLGVFQGGRIETYIPSRTATADDLASVELSKAIIRKAAHYHTLEMPVSKQPELLKKLHDIAESTKITGEVPPMYAHETEDCLATINFPLKEELNWLRQVLPKIGQRVVFSHNDMNPNNILLKNNAQNIDDKVVLVDYEMSMYFYRGYDLAYFLKMKRSRMNIIDNKIFCTLDDEDYLANDEILQEYLNESRKLNAEKFDPKIDNLDNVRMEATFFSLLVDIFIVVIICQAIYESTIPFPLGLVGKITRDYFGKKKNIIEKYGDPSTWK